MSEFQFLSAAALQRLQQEKDLVILDSRDEASYAADHIEGACSVAGDQLATFLQTADKTKPTVVYCYHGISCQAIAQQLASLGFCEVYSLEGGFTGWQELTRKDQTG